MARHVGDPAFRDVPVEALLSKAYARGARALIDPARAQSGRRRRHAADRGGDTTYLSVVDRDGNMVSLIQSNFANFGSGLVPEGAGFALQNRGGLFTLDPTHPNALAPRKRPLHTIIPGFMSDGRRADRLRHHGRLEPGAGARAVRLERRRSRDEHPGGARSARASPSSRSAACDVIDGIARAGGRRAPGWRRKGHEIELQGAFSSLVGGGQSVMRDFDGRRELRRLRSAQGRRRHSGAVPAVRT